MNNTANIDTDELEKFDAVAWQWWNPDGDMRSLHTINPLRLAYIDKAVHLTGKKVLDIGCGGGLLSESMAGAGAQVTGIDAGNELIRVARAHQQLSGMEVDYIASTAEQYAQEHPSCFAVITCMELLEHVPDTASLIGSCATLIKPGGHLIIATLNRTARAYASAILGAEYILRLLPRGTHDYRKFIKPSELGYTLRQHGFRIVDVAGMTYIPGLNICTISANPSVNYLLHAVHD
jgi:2-polyprenyl-6-hydroxyphenyl methylase/3-demethylubiquinone-9 3-methyltransferase